MIDPRNEFIQEVNQMNTGSSVKEPRTDRHIELMDAIRSIEFTKGRAVSLLNRINGYDGTPDEERVEKVTNLKEVLAEAPSVIRQTCSEIDKVLQEIEQSIF